MYSIVVPTFNRATMVEMNVLSLLAQDTDHPYEILVVDNNSKDDTRARIQALGDGRSRQLRYVFEREQGVSAARNAGVKAARGNVIAFIDDDAVAEPGWLSALAEAYRACPDAWCVGGKVVLRLPEVLPQWFSVRSESLKGHLSAFERGDATIAQKSAGDLVCGANFSVRRDVFDRVGLFDTSLGVAGPRRLEFDEVELCWRIRSVGGNVYYCGAAVATHLVSQPRLTKRFFRNRARWRGRTARLVGGRGSHPVGPYHLVRAGLRLALNRISSRTGVSAITEAQVFEAELEFWRRLGYLQQALIMPFHRRKNRQSSAPQIAEQTPL